MSTHNKNSTSYQSKLNPNKLANWRGTLFGVPTALTRGGIFQLSNPRKPRESLTDCILPTRADVVVKVHSGKQLNLYDLQVLLAIAHASRNREIGEWIELTERELLRILQRASNTKTHRALRRSLNRLVRYRFTMRWKCAGEWHPIDVSGFIEGRRIGSKLKLRLHIGTAELWNAKANQSRLQIAEHLGLSAMAQAIHLLFAGQQRGSVKTYRIETLAELTGYSGALREFRYRVQKALEELENAGLAKWLREGDSVRATLNPLPETRIRKEAMRIGRLPRHVQVRERVAISAS